MAKKKTPILHHTPWEAHRDDAIRLAALRWFALTIEKTAIELYATDKKATYPKMVTILRKTVAEMNDLRDDSREEEDGCPMGYVLCDGLCVPACDSDSDDRPDNA
jgi:hypothetical protein